MRKIELGKTGEKICIVGQGTWGFDRPYSPTDYLPLKKSLLAGLNAGSTMIDTAERYGWGNTEKTVGEVIREYSGSRDDIFVATKVWGKNLSPDQIRNSVNRSLKHLGINTIDLYQIHWPNPFKSLSKTMRTMEELVKEGKIRYIGVSNFPSFYLSWAQNCLKKEEIVSNQIYFSLAERKPLSNLVPFAQKRHITLIACSPLGGTKGNRLQDLSEPLKNIINEIANFRHLTFHQVALAWLISFPNVQVIPKAAKLDHVYSNIAVGDITLTEHEIGKINRTLH